MKSSAIGVQEVMYAFLGIVFVVFIFLLASGTLGGLGGFSDFWSNLLGGDLTGEDPDYLIAKNSVEALACAINSVGSGRELACVDDFTSSTATAGFGTGFFAGAMAQESNGATVECEDKYQEYKCCLDITERVTYQTVNSAEECHALGGPNKRTQMVSDNRCKITEIVNEEHKWMPECTGSSSYRLESECEQNVGPKPSDTICTVSNFQLPQEVSKAEEWIKAAGDPKFLIYWQQFPKGEDSAWAGSHPWLEDAIDLVFAWWGAGKVFKIGKTAVKKPVIWAASKIGFKTTTQRLSEKMIAAGISESLAKELTKDMAAIAKTKPSLLRKLTALGIGATEGTLLLGAYLNSKTLKYAEFSNSLILKAPYSDPEPTRLHSSTEGKLIMLKDKSTGFYLASPCKADLEIRKSIIKCDKYSYNFKDNLIDCYDPDFDYSGDVKACDTDISNNFPSESKIPGIIENLDGNKEKLKFYWYTNNMLVIRDPITELIYEFSNDKLSENVGEPANYLARLRFTDSNDQQRSFDVSDAGSIQNNDFSLNFQQDYHYCIQRYDFYDPACTIVADSFSVSNPDCGYCDELREKLNMNRWMVFKEKKEEVEDDEGNKKETAVKILAIVYGEGNDNYYLVDFMDGGGDGVSEFISMKWSNDARGIISKAFEDVADDVFLGDNDEDGKMDFITVSNCKATGEYITVEKDEDIDGHNFCYPETNWIKKATRWAPVAGAGLGGVIGGTIGYFGGGVGAIPGAGVGVSWGTKVGAGIFTAYLAYEKLTGSTDIWPGKKY